MVWNHASNVAAEACDFFNKARADVEMSFFRHHEYSFDIGREAAIHVGELEFVFKIANRAQTTQNNVATSPTGVVNQQRLRKRIDFDVGVRKRTFEKLNALFDGKHRGAFAHIMGDGDDDLVEHVEATRNDADVAVGQRVEASGINGNAGHRPPWNVAKDVAQSKASCDNVAYQTEYRGRGRRCRTS